MDTAKALSDIGTANDLRACAKRHMGRALLALHDLVGLLDNELGGDVPVLRELRRLARALESARYTLDAQRNELQGAAHALEDGVDGHRLAT